jgi:hypothetical protein
LSSWPCRSGAENPVALSGNVNEPPAGTVCDGVGVVTTGGLENVAVTDVFSEMFNAHVMLVLLLHAPSDQLVNVALALGAAVSVMGVPVVKLVPGAFAEWWRGRRRALRAKLAGR